jgi:iron complex outermembrane receptor protein
MKKQILVALLLTYSSLSFSQTNQPQPNAGKSTSENGDTIKTKLMEPIEIRAVRAEKNYPFTQNLITKRNIEKNNLGQDIPFLLNQIPGAVVNSDAGNGVGYTGIRIRGTDASRINFTLNGIAYNDAESQGVFLVNLPDLLSSTNNIQVQRGVGTSANGPGAFGATINLMTNEVQEKAYATISNSIGSFNTLKNTIKTGTGLINGRYTVDARLSNISSDGYMDRSSSKLQSFYVSAASIKEKSSLRLNVFSGKEKTGQAWYGVTEEQLNNNRTYNSAGTEKPGTPYENETDNYQQDHYQLLWNEKINENWSSNFALHYTIGKGYFENYKEDADFAEYGLTPIAGQTATDLIRQKWLDNDFYGTTFSVNYKKNPLEVIIGGGFNRYEGDHFGKVIWSRFASTSELGDRYYDDFASKNDFNMYSKVYYQLNANWLLFGDVQVRTVDYKSNGETGLVDDSFAFFNPKAGITYTLNKHNNLYFSYARANREPNRTDYENGNPKPEELNDFELGWRYETSKSKINVNGYLMSYSNQLILTGALDDVGNPIRSNTDKSYRLGGEVELTYQLLKKLQYQGNITYSTNTIEGEKGAANKQIAFSPSVVSSSMILFQPLKSLKISWLQKYVGEQYLSNAESETSKLSSYMTHDLNFSLEYLPKSIFKSIQLNGLINNVMNKKYVSNGADYGGGAIYYYPQAGINFLIGLTLNF